MTVNKKLDGSKGIIEISGRIDTDTVGGLHEELMALNYNEIDSLALDFTDVQYISSAGLRELLTLKKRMKDRPLVIENISSDVEEIFNITGFSSFLQYTVKDYNVDYTQMSFKEFLAQKVKLNAEKIILEDCNVPYTWEEIDKCSQIIAADLSMQGVKRGTHVGICGTNSANWILTFFAIQKLGAISILLNSNLGVSEIKVLSKAGDITHFCYGNLPRMDDEKSFLAGVTGEDSMIEYVYDIRNSVSFKERLPEYDNLMGLFNTKVETDDASVMIFTSGSTGVPKGVLLSAYNILKASAVNNANLHLDHTDRVCLILPLFHIFGMVAGFIANFVTESTVFIPDGKRTGDLIKIIDEKQITVFHSVPTLLLAMINNPAFNTEKVKSLRCTVLSGAPVSEAQITTLSEKFPNNYFTVVYGLSEMAPVSMTAYRDTQKHLTTTIGKPIQGIEMRIFNEETNEICDAGVCGEIQVQGYNLMCCYYKAALDKQSVDEDGWLHTGDLGYFDEDGYIHFVGRSKELIIRGGENIYPNEIAAAISKSDVISDVKVLGAPDTFWGEIVVAAIKLKEGMTFNEAAMREALSSEIARYKMPEYFFVFEEFPLLPNGKVDAVSLKEIIKQKVDELKKSDQ